jgi:hypothetical protein
MLHILFDIAAWVVLMVIVVFGVLFLGRLKGDLDDYVDARIDAN